MHDKGADKRRFLNSLSVGRILIDGKRDVDGNHIAFVDAVKGAGIGVFFVDNVSTVYAKYICRKI